MGRGGILVNVPGNVLRRILGSRRYGRVGSEDKGVSRSEGVDRGK